MTAYTVYLSLLLFLARLGMGEVQFAKRVPQILHQRGTFLGGISLYAETPATGQDGICPSYTQTCSSSCCPDGCCPAGTYCFVNGDYCCPNNSDCSALVKTAPSCANSTHIMYARPSSAASPYFCCEPDQIALLPNLCVSKGGNYAAASILPSVAQEAIIISGGSSAGPVSTVLTTVVSGSAITSTQASVVTQTVSVGGSESSSTSTPAGNHKSGLGTGAKAGIGAGVAAVFLILAGFAIYKIFASKKQHADEKGPQEPPPAYTSPHAVPPAAPTHHDDYPAHISEMPGNEALRGHELAN